MGEKKFKLTKGTPKSTDSPQILSCSYFTDFIALTRFETNRLKGRKYFVYHEDKVNQIWMQAEFS